MKRKIVADSSANLLHLTGVDFVSVPLQIDAGEHHWVDDETLDLGNMLDVLAAHKGRSCSACPSPDAYTEAFGDADEVFCLPISQGLSGSYNSACVAAQDYMESHPTTKVHVIDTLTAGPAMTMVAEALSFLVAREDMTFEQIRDAIDAQTAKTKVLFSLGNVHNLAANGRLPFTIAKLIGMLNIRLVGVSDEHGKIAMLERPRGDIKAVAALVHQLQEQRFNGRWCTIHHCRNEKAALSLKEQILAKWPEAVVAVGETRGLCSYYAEAGGIMLGFEQE